VQRSVRAADLDADIGTTAAGQVLDPLAGVVGDGVERHGSPAVERLLAAGGDALDGHDRRSAPYGELGGDQAEHALPEHGDRLADVDVGGEHRVQRDGADAGERAGQRVEAGGQQPAADQIARQHDLAAVAPQPPHRRAEQRRIGAVTELDDLADLAVAPRAVRIAATHAGAVDEQPPLRVEPPVEVGVGAAVEGELGAGGDPGVQGVHPYVAWWERRGRKGEHIHPARAREGDDERV
jgi:hypothetical protein